MADDEVESRRRALRELPSISSLLADGQIRAASPWSTDVLTAFLRVALARERQAHQRGDPIPDGDLRSRLIDELRGQDRPRLAKVLNATGVIVHTNLGRSPVSRAAAEAMREAAASAVALEVELETGRRGGRMAEIGSLMRALTGAEATVVVNNNAGAVLLVLAALAAGREVVLARGEAVEIGGGFRIPEVLRQSGARLVEVGTTNRTYPMDYAEAVTVDTAAFLKVHPSNFAISGFTRSATVEELAPIAKAHGLSLIEDLGSGALLDTARFGLRHEPTIEESLHAGATVVTASGDKLFGGPQAGIICGDARSLQRIERHPLARALRADKTCLAGLAATLRHYARDEAVEAIPVWQQIGATLEQLRTRATTMQVALRRSGVVCSVVETRSTVGGGSLPGETLPSIAVAIGSAADERAQSSVDALARRLRLGQPSVFGRIEADQLLLDLRSVLPDDDHALIDVVVKATDGAD